MRAKLAGALLPVVVALAPLATPVRAEDRSPIAITDVRHEASDHQTKIAVECNGPIAYTYYSPDPLTLVIDLPGVDASKVPSRIAVGSREVEAVRVSSMAKGDGAGLARVEVRLASLTPFQIATKGQTLNVVFERPQSASKADDEAATAPEAAPVASMSAADEAVVTPDPVLVAEAAPAPAVQKTRAIAPRPGARASRITGVTRSIEDGQLAFAIHSDGSLKYQDFFLGNPDRLVVDFSGVTSRAPMRPIEVNEGPVRKVRLAQFSVASPKVARLVVDLSSRAPYHIVDAEDGVRVVFGEGRAPTPAPLAAFKEVASAVVEAEPLSAPAPRPAPPSANLLPAPALPAPMMQDTQTAPSPAGLTGNGVTRQYSGHPISLDFKDGDLQDIFRLFADISGLNVVVNPGIAGKVTLKLTEVPWDQALDLILKANGLGYTLENNVIRIARIADLQKEETDLRKLAEEKALTGNLADFSKSLSYAKAEQLSDVLKKAGALSARGSITLDARTNTMLIRDLPAYIEKARLMIDQLDIATPQVEIEARIVVTSRNFTRDLGIQWGFNQSKTAAFGNTTGLAFPNQAVINGQGVPSTGGLSASNIGGSTSGIGDPARGYAVNLPAAGFNSAIGLTLGNIAGNFNLDLALTALERQGRGRLLSTPKVTTQNNQAAEIKQGVQIPIQTVSNNTVTVTFKDAVLTLKVTPQITEAGTVILQLEVENNAADFANLVNGIPPINTQSAKTIVLVRDGATAVIGGIYQSNEQTAQQSTPFLGKLPVLGYLFRNRFLTSTNNELLLFITPRIIKGS